MTNYKPKWKRIGKTAIISAICFFVFVIMGGIFIGLGFVSSDHPGEIVNSVVDRAVKIGKRYGAFTFYNRKEWSFGWQGDCGGWNVIDTKGTSFTKTITLDQNIDAIEFSSVMPYDITIKQDDSVNNITLDFDGDFPEELIDRYDISPGKIFKDADSSPVKISANGDTLTASMDYLSGSFVGNNGRFTITIPEDFGGGLKLVDFVGEVDVNGKNLSFLEMSNGVGNIKATGECGKFTANNNVGNISVSNGDVAAINITNLVGDIDIVSSCAIKSDSKIIDVAGDVEIRVTSGPVNYLASDILGDNDCSLPRDPSAPKLEVSDVMGNVKIST